MLIFPSQVPSAAGPSTGGGTDSQPEDPPSHDPTSFVPFQRYSQVQSPKDMIRFLRTQLEERSQRVKTLEAELKDFHSKMQALSDREDFLLAELAAQVHDLDYKFLLFFVLLYLLFALLFLRVAFAGIQNNAAEENRIVEDELQQLTACSSSSFWSNLDKSRVLLTLRI